MGFGTIVGGGTDGRYTIEIDSGEWLRVQILAQASAAIADLEGRLIVAQAQLVDAEAKEEEARLQAAADMQAYIDNIKPSLLPLPDSNQISFAKLRLVELQKQHQSLRTLIDAIKFDLAEARKVAARMNTLQAKQIRQAWCVDFTEDRAPGSQVGTIEIPGEPKLVLVAPGARGWMPTDGFLLARELHRPDQAYLNGALLPGVAKWKPTYRRGVITAINDEAETCSVDLDAENAGVTQRLNINQSDTLHDVPVEYMECGYSVFEVGDRVVIQFSGQSWSLPKIIGFVDNPRPCNFVLFNMQNGAYFFESKVQDTIDAVVAGSALVEYKLNGATWQTLSVDNSGATFITYRATFDTGTGLPSEPQGDIVLSAVSTPVDSPSAAQYEFPPRLILQLSPSWPPEHRVPNIAEFRLTLGGNVVFNSAIEDPGFNVTQYTPGRAKSGAGISLRTFPNSTSAVVEELDYILTGKTT